MTTIPHDFERDELSANADLRTDEAILRRLYQRNWAVANRTDALPPDMGGSPAVTFAQRLRAVGL